MSNEKVLLISDSIQGPTGFANNAAGMAWCLAKDYDVHVLGLQNQHTQRVKLNIEGEVRECTQHPNLPRSQKMWDFGHKSLPVLLDKLKPDILLTVNDIQMIQHVPSALYPTNIKMSMMDLPSRKLKSRDALMMELEGQIQRFKEKYPLDVKWILYGPQDGTPPMPQWKSVYGCADRLLAFCKFGQDIYKKFYNMDCDYIYHGVDTANFNNQEKPKELQDKFILGSMNRNQPRKQPVRILQAFAKFAKDKPDVFLHMQMDWNDQFGWPLQYFGQMYGIMNKMVKPKPVGIPREEVAKTYNSWDINVNSHAGEGFGLSTIEGAICGLPNILTDYTTSRELVLDGKPSPRGICVPVKELYWEKMDVAAVQRAAIDVDKLSDAFNAYYYNREKMIKDGERGEEWTKKNCSLKVLQNQWINVVKDTLNQ